MSDPPDEDLVAELARLFDRDDPVPPLVTEAAKAALTWRRIDAELAELLSDSLEPEASLAAVRGSAARVRALTFSTGQLTIDVEIRADGPQRTLLGQLSPPATAMIQIQTADEPAEAAAETDSLGRFRVQLLGAHPLRLRLSVHFRTSSPPIQTSWITV